MEFSVDPTSSFQAQYANWKTGVGTSLPEQGNFPVTERRSVDDSPRRRPGRASIGQLGVVRVENGAIVDLWESLVDPEDWFDPWNVRIHGIDARTVEGSPTLPGIRVDLHARLTGAVVVSHSSFNRVAVGRVLSRYGFEPLQYATEMIDRNPIGWSLSVM